MTNILFLFFYYKITFSYWKKRRINGPLPIPIIGNISWFYKNIPITQSKWFKKYGNIQGHYFFSKPMLAIADVHMLDDIMVQNSWKFAGVDFKLQHPLELIDFLMVEGDQCLLNRFFFASAFKVDKLKLIHTLLHNSLDNIDDEFSILAENNYEFDCKSTLKKLTLMVITRCFFSTQIDESNDLESEILNLLNQVVRKDFWSDFNYLILSFIPSYLRRLINFKKSSLESLRQLVTEIVCERKKNSHSSVKYCDLFQLLLDSEYVIHSNEQQIEYEIPEERIVKNLIRFLVSQYDKTTDVLTWSIYILTMKPDYQEKLFRQIKRETESTRTLNYDFYKNLYFLESFIDEVIRMYPPIVSVIKKCMSTHTSSNGLFIEKGIYIHIPIHYINYDEDSFEEPEKFDSTRFLPKNQWKLERSAVLSFGQGSRYCMGFEFAMIQLKMILCRLLLNYRFLKTKRTPLKPLISPKTELLRTNEIRIRVEKRERD